MMTGSRIIAPDGFLSLSKGIVYYFLLSDALNNRVRLVCFSVSEKLQRSQLVTLSRFEFEQALEDGLLVEDGGPDKYPPWLESIKGVSIEYLESRRKSNVKTYDQMVNHRYFFIAELVLRSQEILSSARPDAAIGAHARSQKPAQHPTRVRFWFYTYVVFGRNIWALLPPFHAVGNWDREASSRKNKLGRPSPKGKKWGYHADAQMRKLMYDGFIAHKKIDKTKKEIYGDVMVRSFGCTSIRIKDKEYEYIHKEGKPFPTERQFWYSIKQQTSPDELSIALRGVNGKRSISGSQGSFDELLVNLNQVVEFDGYYIDEKPSGVLEGTAQEGYCVVRARCVLSGLIVGIGFAYGRETMEAYRMALFCMATDKVKFCQLFGIIIAPGEWACEGLPGDIVFDRGPGATYDCLPQINWLGTLELTPTYSGQSKATIESSHPRKKKSKEQPGYKHSDKNFIDLARREIWRVLMDNAKSDASSRLSDDMLMAGVKPTPNGVWDYWDARGRNSSISMQFETSVRSFLTPCSVTITGDAVYLHKRKYRSADLIATGVFDRVARNGVIKATAYVLTMCVRHIWIEVNGVLYELDVVRSARTLEGSIDITLKELELLGQLRRDSETRHRSEQSAIEQYYRGRAEESTGESWDGGVFKIGRPAKGGAAKRDKDDFARHVGKAK